MGILEAGAEEPPGEIHHTGAGTDRFGDRPLVAHCGDSLPGDRQGPGQRSRRPGGEDWPVDEDEVGRHGAAEYRRFSRADPGL